MISTDNGKIKSWSRISTGATLIALMTFIISACFDVSSEQDRNIAAVQAGKNFYQDNCSICHRAGADDSVSAFGATDLAQKQGRLDFGTNGAENLSAYGGQYRLMNQFADLDASTIGELQAYFESL